MHEAGRPAKMVDGKRDGRRIGYDSSAVELWPLLGFMTCRALNKALNTIQGTYEIHTERIIDNRNNHEV